MSMNYDQLDNDQPSIKRAALAGMIGPALFGLVVLLLTIVESDYLRGLGWHPVESTTVSWPSALALGPYGWLQVANFVAFGLLLIAFAIGLRRGVTAGSGANLGTTLLVAAGGAIVLLGFKADPDMTQPLETWHGSIHTVAFVTMAISLLLALIALWRVFRKDPTWSRYSVYTVVTAGLTLVFSVLPLGMIGVYLFLVLVLVWIEVVAVRLWKLASAARPT